MPDRKETLEKILLMLEEKGNLYMAHNVRQELINLERNYDNYTQESHLDLDL